MKKIHVLILAAVITTSLTSFSVFHNVYAAFPYTATRTAVTGGTIEADDINVSNSDHINNNIPESIDDYSANATEMGSTKDPYPSGVISLATTLDDELQHKRFQLDAIIKRFNTSASDWYEDVTDEGVLWVKGADVASASALPLINDGLRVDVTGTATITSFASVGVGTVKTIEFTGALILTHHATNLRLPDGANITTIAGDIGIFHEYASGDWELVAWSGHQTLAAPTIASFANATHDHADAAGGGNTLESPTINTAISGTAFLDEDDMVSDSATKVASQQSIKAYVASVVIPPNYRSGLNCKQATSTTITVEGDVIDVDGTAITKTSDTTLTLTTATDWVDDTSDQAVSTYGYIYINATGKIEMDDVAPDASDTSDNTTGILRYSNTGTDTSWRRMIGWFYMNATGSGELFVYEVGNLKDGDVQNSVVRTDSTQHVVSSASFIALTNTQVHFYSSGRGLVKSECFINGNSSISSEIGAIINDGSDIAASVDGTQTGGPVTTGVLGANPTLLKAYSQGGITFEAKAKVDTGTWTVEEKTMMIVEY